MPQGVNPKNQKVHFCSLVCCHGCCFGAFCCKLTQPCHGKEINTKQTFSKIDFKFKMNKIETDFTIPLAPIPLCRLNSILSA